MAITNLNLNVRANTARALRDFKRFSDTLDNKFLVSGLKLDVIRSSLSQINREFQRSIGEQGLASASSLRAAQNQAALLTQTFKGFASESALAINREIGTALNSLAVRAGGTMKDVQKTISAASFVSIKMPQEEREQLLKDMMSLQRDMRRAGVSENFGGIAQQFLSGRTQAMDLIGSEDAGAAFIGGEILKRSGGRAQITDPRQRSQILAEVVSDPAIIAQFKEMARRTMGYRLVLEDLNTRLFNPEMGLFGSLRKVLGADGRYTTMFDQVERLANTVFGPEGPFATFFKRISEVFNIQDPMQPLIGLVQFTTKISEDINTFLQGDTFGGILRGFKRLFDSVSNFVQGPIVAKAIEDIKGGFKKLSQYLESEKFAELSESVKETFGKVFSFLREISGTFASFIGEIATGSFEPEGIKESIKGIGETVRQFIKDVGQNIRDFDLDEGSEGKYFAEIAGTLFSELGKTAVVLFKELFATLINKIPEVAALVLPQLNNGINTMLTEMFGTIGGKVVKFALGFVPGPIGIAARASAAGDITGGGGNMFSMAAMGAAALLGTGGISNVVGLGRRAFTPQGRMMTSQAFSRWAYNRELDFNRRFLLQDPYGMNTVSPLTNLLAEPLARLLGRSPYALTPEDGLSGSGGINPPGRSFWPFGGRPNPPGGGGSSGRRRFWPFGGGGGYGRTSYSTPAPGSLPGSAIDLLSLYSRITDIPSNVSRGVRSIPSNIRSTATRAVSGVGRGFKGIFGSAFDRYTYQDSVLGSMSRGNKMRMGIEKPYDFAIDEGYYFPIGPQPDTVNNPPRHPEIQPPVLPMDPRFEWASENEPWLASKASAASERVKSLYPSQETIERFNRRYGMRRRIGRGIRRFRPSRMTLLGTGLTAGAIVGAELFKRSDAQEMLSAGIQQVSENKGFGEVFGGVSQGAALGGALGTIVPGIGNVAGAVIGGVIGGVMPLLDKETRESLGQLFSGLRSTFTTTITNLSNGFSSWLQNTWRFFVEGTRENFRKATDFLGSGLRFVANGLISVFNNILTGFQLIPRLVIGLVEKIPGADRLPGFEEAKNAANFQIPTIRNNYAGKDFYGPAMALEARMSGRKPMVVNDGEFVIPSGSGMATLSNLVGQNLQATGVLRQNQGREVSINVQLVVNNSAFVSNADELADRLRAPVHQIINEAWTKVTQTVPYRPA